MRLKAAFSRGINVKKMYYSTVGNGSLILHMIHFETKLIRSPRIVPPAVHLKQLKALKNHDFFFVLVRIALMLHIASTK